MLLAAPTRLLAATRMVLMRRRRHQQLLLIEQLTRHRAKSARHQLMQLPFSQNHQRRHRTVVLLWKQSKKMYEKAPSGKGKKL